MWRIQPMAQQPHAIYQQPTVGWVADVGVCHTRIQPQLFALGKVLALGHDQQTLVDPMLSRHSDQVFEVIQCAVVGHILIIDPHPATIRRGVPLFLFDLPIRPLLASTENHQSQGDFDRYGRPSSFRACVMSPQIAPHQPKPPGSSRIPSSSCKIGSLDCAKRFAGRGYRSIIIASLRGLDLYLVNTESTPSVALS
jgi:hypothetical protein